MRFCFVFLLLFGGCTSRIYLAPMSMESKPAYNISQVYVVNPQLEEEFAILKSSQIFELSSDPTCLNQLTLNEIKPTNWICGNVYMLSWYSLGLVPSRVEMAYEFQFELRGEMEEDITLQIQVLEKYSLYERFKWWKPKRHEILGKALAEAYSELGKPGP